ncbi:RICIN domain-containing protein [Streptomyces sp. NPDC007259]|uniref:RICIN domain-containing protein n=1 Tax=Streptomyces sp. NPDC007259 TaxID=3154319 RepID=UPI0034564078
MDGKVPHELRPHACRSFSRRLGRPRRCGRVPCRHRASRRRTGLLSDRDRCRGCLEIADASTHNDAPLQQYRCLDTDNQRFTTEDAGDGLVRIRTFAGKCLETLRSDPSFNDPIVQGDCDSRYAFQEFFIHDMGDGTVRIEADSTLLWGVDNGHPGLLAPVVLTDAGEPGQEFTFIH